MTRMWTRHGDVNCESVDASAFPIINHDLTIGPTTTVVTALRELVLQRLTDSRGLPKYAQDITFVGWKIRATDSCPMQATACF